MIRILLLFLAFAMPANAEEIVLGLSRDEVSITTTFDGSDILIFGAIKREAPAPDGELGVIVTVSGPDTAVTVRRKEKRFGIWINVDNVEIDAAPSFYAVASNAPLGDVLRASEDLRNRITIPQAIRNVGTNVLDSQSFSRALMRIREEQRLYQVLEGTVNVSNETLFNTSIELPANLTEGDYSTRIFLTRDGTIVDTYETAIPVKKVGVERWLYNMSRENAFLYGIMSLAIAIAAGWTASAAFSFLRH